MNLREKILPIGLGLFLISFLSSCELIGSIFKGGVYVGALMVIVVIVIVIWLILRIFKR